MWTIVSYSTSSCKISLSWDKILFVLSAKILIAHCGKISNFPQCVTEEKSFWFFSSFLICLKGSSGCPLLEKMPHRKWHSRCFFFVCCYIFSKPSKFLILEDLFTPKNFPYHSILQRHEVSMHYSASSLTCAQTGFSMLKSLLLGYSKEGILNLVKKADFRIFNRPIHIPLGFRAVLISYVTLAKVQFYFAAHSDTILIFT